MLKSVRISNAFLSSTDSDIVIDFMSCFGSNFEHSLGLFKLSNGSLSATNFNISCSNGPVLLLNNVVSILKHFYLFHLQSPSAIVTISSNVSISNFSIFHSDVDVLFLSDNSDIYIEDFSCDDSKSLSLFNGSFSFINLHSISILNLSSSHVFVTFESVMNLNDVRISSSLLTSGVMVTVSSNVTIQSSELSLLNQNFQYLTNLNENYLFDFSGGSLFIESSDFGHLYSNLFNFHSTNLNIHTVQISNFFGSFVFSVFDSYFDLFSLTVTNCTADLFMTCHHCNGTVNNFLVENSFITSLFLLNYGSVYLNSTYFRQVTAHKVFGIYSSNMTIDCLREDVLQLYDYLLYSEFSTVRLSSISLSGVRDVLYPFFSLTTRIS
ncbi:hypothetical protein GEMRC1_013352 [Eukaryota sp. GEM-RC1]